MSEPTPEPSPVEHEPETAKEAGRAPVGDISAPTTDTTAPDSQAAPAAPETAPAQDLSPGAVVFYDAPVFGQNDPQVYAGIVLHSDEGRVRVHTLGLAGDSADFPAADLRLNT